ncbi:Maf family protein [Paenibacillus hamazuiensis]|uniref:Maf family protein n=1 Tax=Paenibacillus hamazuiensis TaxID=2936508 RepID=UPI00200EE60B|nr:Maf family protein [Paenibacillus hamazuiensis]
MPHSIHNEVKPKTLILASSSPRRQKLIRAFRLPYEIIVSDVDETVSENLAPAQVVEELSMRKARAVADKIEGRGRRPGIVVGSDTIVVLGGQILGKPKDEADAQRTLQALQGREHLVYSGVACIDLETGSAKASHSVTRVHMAPLSDRQIRRYIETGEPMDKAGGYDSTMVLNDFVIAVKSFVKQCNQLRKVG